MNQQPIGHENNLSFRGMQSQQAHTSTSATVSTIDRQYLQLKNKVEDRIKQLQSKNNVNTRYHFDANGGHMDLNGTNPLHLHSHQHYLPTHIPIISSHYPHMENVHINPYSEAHLQSMPTHKSVPEHKQQCQFCKIQNEYIQISNNPNFNMSCKDCHMKSQSVNSKHSKGSLQKVSPGMYQQIQSMCNVKTNKQMSQCNNSDNRVPYQYATVEGAPHQHIINHFITGTKNVNSISFQPNTQVEGNTNEIFSINKALVENLKAQKQMNSNLKALSQKLSDLSVRRSQSSADFQDKSNNIHNNIAKRNAKNSRHDIEYGRYYNGHYDNGDWGDRRHPYDRYDWYERQPHSGQHCQQYQRDCCQCQYLRMKNSRAHRHEDGHSHSHDRFCRNHIYTGPVQSGKDEGYRRYETKVQNCANSLSKKNQNNPKQQHKFRQQQRPGSFSYRKNNNQQFQQEVIPKSEANQLTGNTNQDNKSNCSRKRSNKIRPIYPNFERKQISKNISKHTGRAKSVSDHTSSVRDNLSKKGGTKNIEPANRNISTNHNLKNCGCEYFVHSKQGACSHGHGRYNHVPNNRNHHPNNFHGRYNHSPHNNYHIRSHSRKILPYDNNYYQPNQIPQRRKIRRRNNQFKNKQSNHYCPLHTTNEVLAMYQQRTQKKNQEIYKDSEYRNRKHERQHLMQAFQQQEKSRKQLLSKISKNFFSSYGVK